MVSDKSEESSYTSAIDLIRCSQLNPQQIWFCSPFINLEMDAPLEDNLPSRSLRRQGVFSNSSEKVLKRIEKARKVRKDPKEKYKEEPSRNVQQDWYKELVFASLTQENRTTPSIAGVTVAVVEDVHIPDMFQPISITQLHIAWRSSIQVSLTDDSPPEFITPLATLRSLLQHYNSVADTPLQAPSATLEVTWEFTTFSNLHSLWARSLKGKALSRSITIGDDSGDRRNEDSGDRSQEKRTEKEGDKKYDRFSWKKETKGTCDELGLTQGHKSFGPYLSRRKKNWALHTDGLGAREDDDYRLATLASLFRGCYEGSFFWF